MTYETEYTFEDLQLVPGAHVVAAGTATVRYKIAPADPDVGLMRPHVEEFEILSIELEPYVLGDEGATIEQGHWLFWHLVDALEKQDAIVEHCMADWGESRHDPYR